MSVDLTGKAVRCLRLPTVDYNVAPVSVVSAQIGDAKSRVLLLSLYDDRGDIDITDYLMVTLRATMPDGDPKLFVDSEPAKLSKTQVVVQIPSGILVQEGRVSCNVILNDGEDNVLTSQTFYIMATATNGAEDGEEVTDEINDALTKVIAAASAAKQSALDAANSAATASIAANNAAQSANDAEQSASEASKQATQAATSAASADESASASAVKAKEAADSAAEATEQATQAAAIAEEAKDEAEKAKEIAENNVPVIGEDGNWYVNGVNTEKPYAIDVDALVHEVEAGEEPSVEKQLDSEEETVTFTFNLPKANGIQSITKINSEGLVDTYQINYEDGSSTIFEVTNGKSGVIGVTSGESVVTEEYTETPLTIELEKGDPEIVSVKAKNGATPQIGENGNWYIDDVDTGKPYAIDITATVEEGAAGSDPTVVKTPSEDGRSIDFKFILPKAKDGVGIESISKKGTSNLTDTYEIRYTDGTTASFEVENGADGVGISSIKKGVTQGLVDYYTITYTNGKTTSFTVTNGKAATITIGKVKTLPYGDPAYVTNVGSDTEAELEIGLPSGSSGVVDVKTGEAVNTDDGYMLTPLTFVFSEGGSKTVDIKSKNNDTVIEYNKSRPLYFWEGTEEELEDYVVPEDRTPMLHFVEDASLVTAQAVAESMGISTFQLKQLGELSKLIFVDTSTQPPTIYVDGTWTATDNLEELSIEKVFTLSENENSVSVTGLTDYGKTIEDIVIPSTYKNKTVTSVIIRDSEKAYSIYIPESVTDSVSIWGCPKLESIEVDPSNTVYRSENNCLIKANSVVAGCSTSVIPTDSGITRISDRAFLGSGIVNLTLPYNVTSVGGGAFYNCKRLKTVIAENPQLNNSGAFTNSDTGLPIFFGCESLEEIAIPFTQYTDVHATNDEYLRKFGELFGNDNDFDSEKFIQIQQHARIGGSSLIYNVLIPKSFKKLKIIGGAPIEEAFENFSTLEEISITGVTSHGENLLEGCTNIKTANIPSDIAISSQTLEKLVFLSGEEILAGAYSGTSTPNLKEVTLCSTIKKIGERAFENNYLEKIHIPTIASYAAIEFGGQYSYTNEFFNSSNSTPGLYLDGELVTDVVIPSGAICIGKGAFNNYKHLSSVILPDTIETIGGGAFAFVPYYGKPNSINTFTFHGNVKSIKSSAFSNCGITDLYINDFNEWINVSLGDWPTSVDGGSGTNPMSQADNIYYDGKKSTTIVIPSQTAEISSGLFCGFTGSIEFEDGSVMTKIGDRMFNGYAGAGKSISIPKSINEIGEYAFYGCGAELVFDGVSLTAIGASAFGEDTGTHKFPYVDNILISDGVTTITSNAFSRAKGIRSITLPETLTEMPSLQYCKSLRSIVIPVSVTSIPSGCFNNATKLWEIYNLSTVSIDISNWGYENVKVVHTSMDEPTVYEQDGDFVFANINGEYILHSYLGASEAIVFPEKHNNKEYSLSQECIMSASSITLPSIDYPYMPLGSSNDICGMILRDLFFDTPEYMPDTLSDVKMLKGKYITAEFLQSIYRAPKTNIVNLCLPDNLTYVEGKLNEVGDNLAYNEYENGLYLGSETNPYLVFVKVKSTDIASINLHADTKLIGDEAFADCNLTSVSIPDGIMYVSPTSGLEEMADLTTTLYDNAYYLGNESNPYVVLYKVKDYGISSCTIHQDTKHIGSGAFFDLNSGAACTNLEQIELPSQLRSIGGYGFAASGITSISLPNSLQSIGFASFAMCQNLTEATLGENTTEIPMMCFGACGFSTFEIPEGVKIIEARAFGQCNNLTTIVLPSTLSAIGEFAFDPCPNLVDIDYNGTKNEWGKVRKEEGWDDNTGSYIIHCIDGDITK